MDPLTENDIRRSFVNCSKGEASRIRMPTHLREIEWSELDFLGWTDPGAPLRALLVVPNEEGPLGVVLRRPDARHSSAMRSSICHICFTGHAASGVCLFVAPLAGAAGRQGNSVGQYMCADLACSLYLRGKRQPRLRLVRHEETLTLDERIDRAMKNLFGFTSRITGGD